MESQKPGTRVAEAQAPFALAEQPAPVRIRTGGRVESRHRAGWVPLGCSGEARERAGLGLVDTEVSV